MDVHQQSSTHAVLLQSWPTPTSITSVRSLLLPSSCNKVYILTVEMLSYLQLCVATHSCQPQAHSGSLSAQPQYHVAFVLLGLSVCSMTRHRHAEDSCAEVSPCRGCVAAALQLVHASMGLLVPAVAATSVCWLLPFDRWSLELHPRETTC